MWCHLLTIFNRRFLLPLAAILMLFVAFSTTLLFATQTHAAPAMNQTIGFQGRLLDANGDIVPNGYYNIQFKIYEGGSGTVAGNPDGTLKWTESYINNGNATGAVQVTNGYMSINLGSINPFGTSINWDSSTLLLSMNVAGKATGCTTFGAGACAADGEMLPMKRLTASPYAMSAGSIGGKTANQFLQLAQGVQTDSSTESSLYINKNAAGNLVQLQNAGIDIFTIGNTGDLTFGSNDNKTISVATGEYEEEGKELTVAAGGGGVGRGASGGTLNLQGGAAGGSSGAGGWVSINAGASTGVGAKGQVVIGESNTAAVQIGSITEASTQAINVGTNNTIGSTTNVNIGAGADATAGTTNIQAKNAVTIQTNGTTRATFSDTTNTVYFGNGVTSTAPNNYTVQGTNSSQTGVAGGALTVKGGDATVGNANGANVTISGGTGSGTGTNGLVVLTTPTFSTVSDDANCYTAGAPVAASCTVALSSVNNASSIIVGFSTTGKTATMPDPTNKTAGRILYVTAADTSQDFTLSINGGGASNLISMHKNTTVTLLWNGSDWTSAGASTSNSSGSLDIASSTSNGTPNVQIGDGAATGTPTLLTLDKASTAPVVTDSALLGSMYYDTTKGEVQCYEAEGWGGCSSSPDTFVSLSPEYSGAVMNGTENGTMTTDFCSDTLNINSDNNHGNFAPCDVNETFNYYQWIGNSSNVADTGSIYVTYKLPDNFKSLITGSTSLMAKTDGVGSSVDYHVYKNNDSGLTSCGDSINASIDGLAGWTKSYAQYSSEPASCGFAAGDSIIFRIDLTSLEDGKALISNLDFAYNVK